MAENMHQIPNGHYSMEMRSGKILNADDGFKKMFGFTDEDVENGLVFKQLVPDVEYNQIIDVLREQFIVARYACFQHEMKDKNGNTLHVVSFINIQNKLLEGHRVLTVGVAKIADSNL